MNAGLRVSRGDVVGTLNADDFYEPNSLNRVLDQFATLPVPSLLVGNCNVWADNSISFKNIPSHLEITYLAVGPKYYEFPYNPSAYFYHKILHESVGFFDEADHYTMDVDFLLSAVRVANLVYVNETYGNYRTRPDSKTERDKASGEHSRRMAQLLSKHRRQLPIRQRAIVYTRLARGAVAHRLAHPFPATR